MAGLLLDPARRLARALAALGCGALPAVAAVVPPGRPLPVDLCVLHRLTGLPCLTCGLTRAVCLLARGEWEAGLRMQPAAAPLLGAVVAVGIWQATAALSGRAARARLSRRVIVPLAAAGLLLAALHWISRFAG